MPRESPTRSWRENVISRRRDSKSATVPTGLGAQAPPPEFIVVSRLLTAYRHSVTARCGWLPAAVFNIGLWWLVVRWVASHLASEGAPLPIAFDGRFPPFLGWYAAYYLSILTIIGWAWVANAWTRWNCRQITGTRRRLEYRATGLEMLWRTVAAVLTCFLVIPIPWVMNWYMRWYVSQFTLTERPSEPASR